MSQRERARFRAACDERGMAVKDAVAILCRKALENPNILNGAPLR